MKSITQKTWIELQNLRDKKLISKLDWLNHIGYSEAFEESGRLYYRFAIKLGRSFNEIKEVSTMRNETGIQIEIKNG
jgi:hypothetical protein